MLASTEIHITVAELHQFISLRSRRTGETPKYLEDKLVNCKVLGIRSRDYFEEEKIITIDSKILSDGSIPLWLIEMLSNSREVEWPEDLVKYRDFLINEKCLIKFDEGYHIKRTDLHRLVKIDYSVRSKGNAQAANFKVLIVKKYKKEGISGSKLHKSGKGFTGSSFDSIFYSERDCIEILEILQTSDSLITELPVYEKIPQRERDLQKIEQVIKELLVILQTESNSLPERYLRFIRILDSELKGKILHDGEVFYASRNVFRWISVEDDNLKDEREQRLSKYIYIKKRLVESEIVQITKGEQLHQTGRSAAADFFSQADLVKFLRVFDLLNILEFSRKTKAKKQFHVTSPEEFKNSSASSYEDWILYWIQEHGHAFPKGVYISIDDLEILFNNLCIEQDEKRKAYIINSALLKLINICKSEGVLEHGTGRDVKVKIVPYQKIFVVFDEIATEITEYQNKSWSFADIEFEQREFISSARE